MIDSRVTIDLILPDAALAALTDQQVEDINEQFRTTFTPYNFQRIEIDARGSRGGYRLLSDFLPKIEIPRKEPLSPALPPSQTGEGSHTPSPANAGEGRGGGLSNKTVFVSAGHGWSWNTTFNTYRTQRPVYPAAPYPSGEGIVEDFNNAEAVNQYLLPYLQNAGADAWTVRERDMNTQMVIVDDNSAGFSTQGTWTNNSGRLQWNVSISNHRECARRMRRPRGRSRRRSRRLTPSMCVFPAPRSHAPSMRISSSITPARSRPSPSRRRAMATTGASSGTIPSMADNRHTSASPINQPHRASPCWPMPMRIGGGLGDTSVAGIAHQQQAALGRTIRPVRQVGRDCQMSITYNDVIVRPIYSEWEKEPGEDAVYIVVAHQRLQRL